jgi:AAA family ATP:ADP antiporter
MTSRVPTGAGLSGSLHIVGLSALAFSMMFSYALARPSVESLFLEAHGSEALPWVWLLVTVTMVAGVARYNRHVHGRPLLQLLATISWLSSLVAAVLLVAHGRAVPGVGFALYVWKDLYIIFLIEIFYTHTNVLFSIQSARWLYGLFGALAALGGVGGAVVTRTLAPSLGTVTVLWTVPGLLILIGLLAWSLSRGAAVAAPPQGETPTIRTAVKRLWSSEYLLLILLLVGLSQAAITLVDFEFNQVIEKAYRNTDERTAVMGLVYGTVNAATVGLNLLAGPLLRLLGAPIVLLSVPLLLTAGVGVFYAAPLFATAAAVKVASKCFDYSIFRAAKEILYIPLGFDDKTQGKALVDMVTYRAAKGCTSLVLVVVVATQTPWFVGLLLMGTLAAWVLLTVTVGRRFRRRVSRSQELFHTPRGGP